MDKYLIKLNKTSRYSYSITIPKAIVEKYSWQSKQKLIIKDKGRGLLELRDWKSR